MASTIGIITVGQDPIFFSWRYFREILTTVSQELIGHDCSIRIVSLQRDPHNEASLAQAFLATQSIDAALIVAPTESFLQEINEVLHVLPSIVIASPHLDIPYSYVDSDNYKVMRQIVEHLAGTGRKRIRILQPEILTGDYWERARGYNDAMQDLGLEPMIGVINHPPITSATIERNVLIGSPDAVIAPNDNDALAILSHFQRRGIKVPADIALVGFDDEDFAAETYPTLTTVCQPLDAMARRATCYLLDCLTGIERGIYQEILPNRLIVRESTAH